MRQWSNGFYINFKEEMDESDIIYKMINVYPDISKHIAEKIASESSKTLQWIDDDERMHTPSKQFRFYEHMINFIDELQGVK